MSSPSSSSEEVGHNDREAGEDDAPPPTLFSKLPAEIVERIALLLDPDSLISLVLSGADEEGVLGQDNGAFWHRFVLRSGLNVEAVGSGSPLRTGQPTSCLATKEEVVVAASGETCRSVFQRIRQVRGGGGG